MSPHEFAMDVDDFDPTDPAVLADPYPTYRRLRMDDPVHFNAPGGWLLTRYADVASLLRDPRLSSDRRTAGEVAPALRALTENPSMVSLDPPDHTRLRRIVNKAFTPRQVEGLRPRVEAIVDGLLERVDGRFELMDSLARPLPVEVICEMLAVPAGDRPFIRKCSADLTYLFELVTSVERRQTGLRGWVALSTYFEELAVERRAKPGDDLLSMLLVVEEAGDRLTRSEVVSMANLLLFAGHDTTINLIGNGVLALLQHPDELARLRDDPGIVGSAVEELLRYDSPVQFVSRVTKTDLVLGGRLLGRQDVVFLCLGAANRDPDHFADPDRLDLGRADNRHVAFGGGPHFCLGTPLARIEGAVLVSKLFDRFPRLGLAGEPQWRDTSTIRGLSALPLATEG